MSSSRIRLATAGRGYMLVLMLALGIGCATMPAFLGGRAAAQQPATDQIAFDRKGQIFLIARG
jgi:hypothetical protein